jgi:hypothetical protein
MPIRAYYNEPVSSFLRDDDEHTQLHLAFKNRAETSLRDFGFAITTRMQMLGLSIRRLNARVTELRKSLGDDEEQFPACLEKGYAFRLPDTYLAYNLLLDMDSFIFESRSLYEIRLSVDKNQLAFATRCSP